MTYINDINSYTPDVIISFNVVNFDFYIEHVTHTNATDNNRRQVKHPITHLIPLYTADRQTHDIHI